MQDHRREQNESPCRLALQFIIGFDELTALCERFKAAILDGSQKGFSPGMIAVTLTRIVKEAIDLKFEKKLISPEHLILAHDAKEPELNRFKANIVRGMFLTFIEHKRGFPGLFDILGGIAAAGLGFGTFCLPDSNRKVKLSELARFYPDKNILRDAQIKLMLDFFTPEKLSGFASARLGLYSMLVGCSLLPFYSAAAAMSAESADSTAIITPDLHAISQTVMAKFHPGSERLQKFLAQNLFVVLFEELFTHESTVFSIFD